MQLATNQYFLCNILFIQPTTNIMHLFYFHFVFLFSHKNFYLKPNGIFDDILASTLQIVETNLRRNKRSLNVKQENRQIISVFIYCSI